VRSAVAAGVATVVGCPVVVDLPAAGVFGTHRGTSVLLGSGATGLPPRPARFEKALKVAGRGERVGLN